MTNKFRQNDVGKWYHLGNSRNHVLHKLLQNVLPSVEQHFSDPVNAVQVASTPESHLVGLSELHEPIQALEYEQIHVDRLEEMYQRYPSHTHHQVMQEREDNQHLDRRQRRGW